MIHASILDTIGETPIVELSHLAPKGVRLFGKVESFNPMGSIKDRLAVAVIEQAERDGLLKPGMTVVEATSGNTGIGLAMVCAAKGYPLVIVMAESFSIERRKLMRFLGAKVVLTPAALKGTGMYLKAAELAETHGWFWPRQFENEANAQAHTRTTAQEILRDFGVQRLDYWVTLAGTGGTLKGVARGLRAGSPHTRIVLVEPDNAQLYGGGVPQPPSTGLAPASHPKFQPHPIQGVSPDFIAKLTADALDGDLIDEIVPVAGSEAMRLTHALARQEGICAGISSGAALAGAMVVARTAPEGSTILCMLPDTGERYLSTPLFSDVPTEMTPEEQGISASSPSARFEVSTPVAPVVAPTVNPDHDAEATAMLDAAIRAQPVVLFVLEWCEFCWSLRKFFDRIGLAYEAVEIDSATLHRDDLGGRLRRVLAERTGMATIPQMFIAGEFVGGCLDVFEAWGDGTLQARLAKAKIDLPAATVDPYDHLPNWLERRPSAPADSGR